MKWEREYKGQKKRERGKENAKLNVIRSGKGKERKERQKEKGKEMKGNAIGKIK